MDTIVEKANESVDWSWKCPCGAWWLDGLNLVYCGTCGAPRFKKVRSISPFLISAKKALTEASGASGLPGSGCTLTSGETLVVLEELQKLER